MSNIVKIKGFGVAPKGKRPIGFRGLHNHGLPLNDPVYPTSTMPRAFIPRYPADWRNAGRRMLTMGMARLEGTFLSTYKQSLNWQIQGPCGEYCAGACSKSNVRCLCSWRVKDSPTEHLVRMDGILREFKGEVITKKPIWTPMRKVIQRNRFHAEAMAKDPETGTFRFINREAIRPEFDLMNNRNDDHYKGIDPGWASDSDAEFSDDEGYCSDEERENGGKTAAAPGLKERKMVGKK